MGFFSKQADGAEHSGASALESSSHAERTTALPAAIASIEARRAAELAALDEQRGGIHTRAAREIADAEARAERTRQRLADELAATFHGEAGPLVASWLEQPSRKLAVQIVDAVRRADERARREIGGEISPHAVGAAFALQIVKERPNAANVFGHSDDWGSAAIVGALYQLRRSIDAGGNASEAEAALAQIERTMLDVARTAPMAPSDAHVRRLKARASAVTDRDMTLKLAAFDEAEGARAEAAAPRYAVPENLRIA